eukprot:2131635-Pleurochrysis_carterae.AAC.1
MLTSESSWGWRNFFRLEVEAFNPAVLNFKKRISIIDGAKSLVREYSCQYPLPRLFRCYRHLLADLQKSSIGRAAVPTFKTFTRCRPRASERCKTSSMSSAITMPLHTSV